MAKNKIERIDQEIAKVREKIAEYQEKLKALEVQKTEAENLEIVQMVRALRMTPAQLSAMLSGGTVPGSFASPGRAEAGKGKCKCPVPEVPTGKSSVYQQPSLPLAAKTEYQKAVCRRQAHRSDCRKYRPGCVQNRKSRKDGKRKGTAGRGIRHAPQEGLPDGRGFFPHRLYADEYHVLLLYDGTEYWFCNFRHYLSIG